MTRALLALTLVLSSAPAFAQAPDNEEPIRGLFEQGTRALEEGRFADARRLLGEVYSLAPRPAAAFNLAIAMTGTGEFLAAVALFDHMLAGDVGPLSDEVRARVVERRAIAERSLAHIAVTARPGARVRVDGEIAPPETWGDVRLDPGRHSIDAASSGFEPDLRWLELEPGAHETIAFDLAPAHAGPHEEDPTALAPAGDAFWDSAWPWILGGVLVAGAAAAIWAGVWYSGEPQDIDETIMTLRFR